jgi:hypothetical protein
MTYNLFIFMLCYIEITNYKIKKYLINIFFVNSQLVDNINTLNKKSY